jgi:hypothetical protein
MNAVDTGRDRATGGGGGGCTFLFVYLFILPLFGKRKRQNTKHL